MTEATQFEAGLYAHSHMITDLCDCHQVTRMPKETPIVCVSEEYRLQYRSPLRTFAIVNRSRKKLCGNLQAVRHVATKIGYFPKQRDIVGCCSCASRSFYAGFISNIY